MRSKIIRFVVLIGVLFGVESKLTPVVKTTTGPVQGEVLTTVTESKEYSSFKGIPYAEPPLGYLRFKPPVPKTPWKDVLETTIEGANCVQNDFIFKSRYTGSEDCLYLNVYTPKLDLEDVKSSSLLPVMVWIYGGTFKSGYGNSSLYGPDFIIEENVVLVTFNYRLGPLGFLSLEHENATGNAGLKDQNLVLRWVKNNIVQFGGNPDSITIFGQSAGGVSVDMHGLSEMSEGLFHRSISMSASPLCPWAFYTPQDAVSQAFKLARKLGTTTTDKDKVLEKLYGTPAVEMMKVAEGMGIANPPFKPTIENTKLARDEEKFFTKCSYWKYVTGHFNKVPHLTGFTANEVILFAGSVESIVDAANYAASIVKTFPSKFPVTLPITNRIVSSIANGTMELTNDAVLGLINEASDILFVAPIDLKQRFIQLHSGRPVYYYRFSFDSEKSLHRILYDIKLNGTAHGDDIAYLFYMPVTNLTFTPNDPGFTTRKRMVRLWTNFAKYGNPTPDGKQDALLQGITWPSSKSMSNYLEFDKDLTVKRNPIDASVPLIKTANLAILPAQTGCVGDLLGALGNLNPLEIGDDIASLLPPLPSFG